MRPSSSICGCTGTSRTSGGSVASNRLNSSVHENVALLDQLVGFGGRAATRPRARPRFERRAARASASVRAAAAAQRLRCARRSAEHRALLRQADDAWPTLTAAQAAAAASAAISTTRTRRSL